MGGKTFKQAQDFEIRELLYYSIEFPLNVELCTKKK